MEKIIVTAQRKLGKLDIEQVAIHEYLLNTFIKLHLKLIEFDYIIYLKTPPDICFERTQIRKRSGEFDLLTKEYLQLLHHLYENWACNDFTPLHKRKYIESDGRLPTSVLINELFQILEEKERAF